MQTPFVSKRVHRLTNIDFSSNVNCYYHASKKPLRDALGQANLIKAMCQ